MFNKTEIISHSTPNYISIGNYRYNNPYEND